MPETCWRLSSDTVEQPRQITISPSRCCRAPSSRRSSRPWRYPVSLVVRSLQQLLAAVVKLRTDGLLHSRIRQFPLSCGFLRYQLHDRSEEHTSELQSL